jgi:hypothetical protein
MRVTIIVPDSTVYIGMRSCKVQMPELEGKLRAVQWQEHAPGVGHIELPDGKNEPLDTNGFKAFEQYVFAAQLVFDAEDAAAREVVERDSVIIEQSAALESLIVKIDGQ